MFDVPRLLHFLAEFDIIESWLDPCEGQSHLED
jgi:hypothetical protein